MKVLLDNNVNRKFAHLLTGHEVHHASQIGWGELENGMLVSAAEQQGFNVLITADKSMQYQQNLSERAIIILVLNSLFIKWQYIEPLAPLVLDTLNSEPPLGSFILVGP